jgi:hypothetical protein
MAMKREDSLVREIIERYGEVIDLRQSPYLIVEIIRRFGPEIGNSPVADCQPPGGPPPKKFDPDDVMQQIRMRLAEIESLTASLRENMGRSSA